VTVAEHYGKHVMYNLSRQAFCEFLGTFLLVATIVGSGIAAERLSAERNLTIFASAAVTGAIVFVLVTLFKPISGAHLNPAITVVIALKRIMPLRNAGMYILAQTFGAVGGVIVTRWMFGLPLTGIVDANVADAVVWGSEALATCGLILTVILAGRYAEKSLAVIVAAYVFATFYALPSSVANPAATVARSLTDTRFGIGWYDVVDLVTMQVAGVAGAIAVLRSWFGRAPASRSTTTSVC
jgi:glycerol uptake facilitator-like aquaporin